MFYAAGRADGRTRIGWADVVVSSRLGFFSERGFAVQSLELVVLSSDEILC